MERWWLALGSWRRSRSSRARPSAKYQPYCRPSEWSISKLIAKLAEP